MMSAAEIAAAKNVAEAKKKRTHFVESLAGEKAARQGGGGRAGDAEGPERYKERMAELAKKTIPDSARGVRAGKIMDDMIAESVGKVNLDKSGDKSQRNIDLVVGLAQEVGASRAELDDMLRKVADPDDHDTTEYLRKNVLPRINDSEGDSSDASGAQQSKAAQRPSVPS